VLNNRIRTALVVLAASAGLGACTNFGPYGGGGIGVGYGSPYGYGYGSGYGNPYYGSYYGRNPYYGWYDGFYYPGTGYWVYDPDGQPRPITEKQKSYWASVLQKFRQTQGANAQIKSNWDGFSTQGKVSAPVTVEGSAQADPRSLRELRAARRQAQIERQQSQVQQQQTSSESRGTSIRQIMRERAAARRAAQPKGE
jgi:hypothetical protein